MNRRPGMKTRVCPCGYSEVRQDGSTTITDLRKAYCAKCGDPVIPQRDSLIDLPKAN